MVTAAATVQDTMSTIHEAALMYAEHGVHIFPCQPREKTPAIRKCVDAHLLAGDDLAEHAATCDNDGHGFHDATNNLDTIKRWWTEMPDANIGIALGPNNVFAVDVDGPEGRAALDHLEDTHTPLPDTYKVITGRTEGSGRHHLYRQPADGKTIGNGRLGNKIDIKGDGGYVIAPPSIHPSGRPYLAEGKWSQIADPPAWLIDLIRKPPPPTVPTPTLTLSTSDNSAAIERVRAAARTVAHAEEGNRNNVLNWASYRVGQVVGAGQISRDVAEQLLLNAAALVGLAEHESRATVASGLTSGTADPDPTVELGAVPPATVLRPDLTDTDTDRYLPVRLDRFLAVEDEPVTYRIHDIWPAHGRALLAAQFKAGKSTTVGNVLRSLADGDPLFGKYQVEPPGRPILLIDDELHETTVRRWLREQDIHNTHNVYVLCLRGRLGVFDIMNPQIRTWWADTIRQLDIGVVVLDCLRPIIDAMGLSEDKDVGKVLVALDELVDSSGATEALIVHHMGHSGERSRGDSRLRDWPDVEWKLVRDTKDGEDNPAAPRFFSAYGRDVDEPEQALELDGRHLTIVGGNRKQRAEEVIVQAIVKYVRENPGAGLNDLREHVEGKNSAIGEGRDTALGQHLIRMETGARGAHCYFVTDRGTTVLGTTAPRAPHRAPDGGARSEYTPNPVDNPVDNPPRPTAPHRAGRGHDDRAPALIGGAVRTGAPENENHRGALERGAVRTGAPENENHRGALERGAVECELCGRPRHRGACIQQVPT